MQTVVLNPILVPPVFVYPVLAPPLLTLLPTPGDVPLHGKLPPEPPPDDQILEHAPTVTPHPPLEYPS